MVFACATGGGMTFTFLKARGLNVGELHTNAFAFRSYRPRNIIG